MNLDFIYIVCPLYDLLKMKVIQNQTKIFTKVSGHKQANRHVSSRALKAKKTALRLGFLIGIARLYKVF